MLKAKDVMVCAPAVEKPTDEEELETWKPPAGYKASATSPTGWTKLYQSVYLGFNIVRCAASALSSV